jgi:hypothetical protein
MMSLPAVASPADLLGQAPRHSLGAGISPRSARLAEFLGARERVITAADVQSLGEKADRILIAAASDGKASRWRRARALLALQFAPSTESLTFLRAVIAEKKAAQAGADVLDLAAALTSLGPYGRDALPDLLPLLTHSSADVRHAVVQALSSIREPEAESALRARLYVEREAGIREAVARALIKK